VVNFDALARHGMIAPRDLGLFHFADTPGDALAALQRNLGVNGGEASPALARSVTPERNAVRPAPAAAPAPPQKDRR